jgi:hypothetical protein
MKFLLPLLYNKKTKKLNNSVVKDVELIETQIDDDNNSPIYEQLFCSTPATKFDKAILRDLAYHYTTDVSFLKETQLLTKNLKTSIVNATSFSQQWQNIIDDNGFFEKYIYLEETYLKHLNNNPFFLQILSLYTFTSPLISLIMPILLLLMPLIIMKSKGIKFSSDLYAELLRNMMKHNAILKCVTQFQDSSSSQKAYLAISAGFYVFSMYQNILSCIKFYTNFHKIRNYLEQLNIFLKDVLAEISIFQDCSKDLQSYELFNKDLKSVQQTLTELNNRINIIFSKNAFSHTVLHLGDLMHIFYDLYTRNDIHEAMSFAFHFRSYLQILQHIQRSNQLTSTQYSVTKHNKNKHKHKVKTNCQFKGLLYPTFHKNNGVKNNCKITNNNIIITGPNASGKTTILKAVLINILLSQQIGFGTFEQCFLTPFQHIHSYLNIPDTSNRDSLFQAEARRCKDILDCIKKYPQDLHFCIFDELYSGTNPTEAISNANAFIKFIAKRKNVSFMLTTHYVDLCKQLTMHPNITNMKMKCSEKQDNIEFHYILEQGISEIKGGFKILNDMNYPQEILDLAKQNI